MLSAPPTDLAEFKGAFQARIARQADVWFKDGEFPKAVHLLRARAETVPSDYEAWTDLGWMASNIELWDEAEAIYRRFAQANPGDPDRRLPLIQFFDNRKRYADTIREFGPSVTDAKAHPNHWRLLARAYEKESRIDDSIRVWNEYLKGHPADETAKANLRRVTAKRDAAKG